jgi:hypothetical protein
MVTAVGCKPWWCGECPPACPNPAAHQVQNVQKEHNQLFINKTKTGCEVVDSQKATAIEVPRGDWVVWNNQYGEDVLLVFGPRPSLFGVSVAVAYSSGDPLKLQLRGDAPQGRWEYRVSDMSGHPIPMTQPAPIIIVPPPPEP